MINEMWHYSTYKIQFALDHPILSVIGFLLVLLVFSGTYLWDRYR
jgi:hypothetical protein